MELYSGYLDDHFNPHKLSIAGSAVSPPEYMASASPAQFAAAPLRMGYGRPAPAPPPPVMGMWSSEPFRVDSGSGGRAVAGHGEAAAEPRGDPDGRGRPVRAPRPLHAADGHRGGHTERARQLRDPGGPSPADDAAADAQDPDAAAGGQGPPGARRLLPAPPHAQLDVGGAPAGGGGQLDAPAAWQAKSSLTGEATVPKNTTPTTTKTKDEW
ncbi:Transcription factor TGA4 [Zea mays]|uniref:Transcription factor TGA4 n=1 Tax=Zea mays TaxID=4577 RepID=A0A1D6JFC9_MAIZE|nr:Transcription factor TGA4 [Zea mays]